MLFNKMMQCIKLRQYFSKKKKKKKKKKNRILNFISISLYSNEFMERKCVNDECYLKIAKIHSNFKWLEHLWNHVNMYETGVVRASEC